ncbi:MAG TPA: pilus assembly protein HicB [Verrucomicrobiales bacterium]|nr:pilus assembly protein HicB [Verrucomicrobiales bacterium]
MKAADKYHKLVDWSAKDGVYIGHCPDLITGIHGNDPVKLYEELCEVVNEVVSDLAKAGRRLPKPRVRPMLEFA